MEETEGSNKINLWFTKLLDPLPGNRGFLATAALFGVTVKKNGHHPVGQPVMTCIFQSRQQVWRQFVEFNAFLIIWSGSLMEVTSFFQVFLDIVGKFLVHLLQIRFVF